MLSKKLSNKNFRAIFFDFDGTLRFNDPLAHHFFLDFAVSLGAKDSVTNRRAASRWAHQYWNGHGEVVTDSEAFGFGTDEFWLNYTHKHLLSFNCTEEQAVFITPQLRQHMHENYEPNDIIDPATPELLDTFRKAGFVLGVVSNRDEPYNDLLDSLGIADLFDFTLAAGEVNSWKPDGKIFTHALQMSGMKADETLYIGDNYYADVVGSRQAGLSPVLIDPESIFPDADCPVIREISDLSTLLT